MPPSQISRRSRTSGKTLRSSAEIFQLPWCPYGLFLIFLGIRIQFQNGPKNLQEAPESREWNDPSPSIPDLWERSPNDSASPFSCSHLAWLPEDWSGCLCESCIHPGGFGLFNGEGSRSADAQGIQATSQQTKPDSPHEESAQDRRQPGGKTWLLLDSRGSVHSFGETCQIYYIINHHQNQYILVDYFWNAKSYCGQVSRWCRYCRVALHLNLLLLYFPGRFCWPAAWQYHPQSIPELCCSLARHQRSIQTNPFLHRESIGEA